MTSHPPPPSPEAGPPGCFSVGEWQADASLDQLSHPDGRAFKLEPRTMRLLLALARAQGGVVGGGALLAAVWPGVVVTPASLYEAVAQLRKLMGAGHIATVPRKGYRIVAPVQGLGDGVLATARAALPAALAAALFALGPQSVAVLPFRVRGVPASHGFIRESLADDLIAELSRQPGLVVVARGTMLSYAATPNNPLEVSRQLGARFVIDGLLEAQAGDLCVTVQIADGWHGTQTWADTLTLQLAAWYDTAPVVVGRLARALNLEVADLAARSQAAGPGGQPRHVEALALAGRAWVELFARPQSRETNDRAFAWARQARALQPTLARAAMCEAFCEWRAGQYGWPSDARHGAAGDDAMARALALVEQAVELDPRDPDGHYVLALVALRRGELARAEEALRHCLRLCASYAPAHGLLGLVRTRRGFPEEAAALCDRAFLLSPREPLRAIWHMTQAAAALALGDFANALEQSQRGMAVNADFATCYVTGAAAAQQLGDVARARAWVGFLRERSAFSSQRALRELLAPGFEPAQLAQLERIIALLAEAGLPAG